MPQNQSQPKGRSYIYRYGLLAGLVLAMIAIYASGLGDYLSFDTLVKHREDLLAFVRDHFVLALAGYMLIYAIAVALSLPGGSILTILGGFLFGWLIGGMVTVIAASLGATVIFLAARSSFGDLLVQKAGSAAQKLSAGLQKDAWSYLLFLRLVPVFPFWLVNIAPALFAVPLKTYFLTTVIGIIPGTMAFSFLGEGLDDVIVAHQAELAACRSVDPACELHLSPQMIINQSFVIALSILGVLALLPIVIKKLKRQPMA